MDWRQLPRPYRRTGREVTCAWCGKTIYRPGWQLRDYPVSYCSNRCRGLALSRRYPVNLDFFAQWSPEMAYVLGLFYSDGCIGDAGQVSFVGTDPELVEFVRDHIAPTSPIANETTSAGTPVYRWRFWSDELKSILQTYGLTPRKSKTIPWPVVPDPFVWDFLRGVIDGDGHIDRVHRITISTGSLAFANGCVSHMGRLGVACKVYPHRTDYQVSFGIPASRLIAPILYPAGAFCLARKRNALIPA